MKAPKQIMAYCPKCGKHTLHTSSLYSKRPDSGLAIGTRRAARKRKGYFGKVKGKATAVKIGKRQKLMMKCNECGYTIEKVYGGRTKKKLEIAA
ncbi:MAG: 50S ribosomal protein L44e [Candidatus Marsarchaeota archaeon]|jgi:large subunit ribosomal protein L44e|nr:50S ribosomal protein L44e [Candidatus Marsarchaeota archaeon]MCL5112569.1 50S ribosomal protein L44e [Candidatus Marsarchaeota archaeon]